jgi:hypothetical protein
MPPNQGKSGRSTLLCIDFKKVRLSFRKKAFCAICMKFLARKSEAGRLEFISRWVAIKNAIQGLPDFSWYNIPKQGKIYQSTPKYTKCP